MSTSPRFKTILVVDDDLADRLIASHAIRKYNADAVILEAIDGAAALALLEDPGAADPDLIILDINMPGMNGIEFLERYEVRPDSPHIVAMVSSSGAEIDKERCGEFNSVVDYIVKPLEAKDLLKLESELS
ncbi:MAG: response regulator [Myxococcota bacterium]